MKTYGKLQFRSRRLAVASCHTLIGIASFVIWGVGVSKAAILFSQDFSSSTTLSDYVGTGANQFDGISTSGSSFNWTINNSTLRGVRTGNAGAITRSTDLATTSAAIYKFTLNVTSSTAAATSAITFQNGTGFSPTLNSTEANASTHTRFGINLTATSGFTVRDITGGTNGADTFTGAQNLFLIDNNSGATITYTGPDGSTQTVGDDKWDLWVGNNQEFNESSAQTGTVAPTDFKLAFTGGTATVLFDNFEVSSVVPEPATILGGALMVGVAGWSQRRRLRGLAGSLPTRRAA